MKQPPSQDTFTALRAMYYLSNLVGLAPFTWVTEESPRGRKRKKCIPSWYGRLHTIFMVLTVTTGTAVMTVWRIAYSYPRIRKVTVLITDLTLLFISYAFAVVSLIQCAREHHHSLSRMLTSITRVDDSLLYVCEKVWKNTGIFQASQFIYFVVYEVFFCLLQYNVWAKEHGTKNRNHIPISCIIHAVICVTEIRYFNLVLMLKRRFFILNSRFDSFPVTHRTASRTQASGVYFSTTSTGKHIQERQLRIGIPNEEEYAVPAIGNCSTRELQQQLHRQRCVSDIFGDVVSSVNSMYGLNVLLSLTLNFMSVTACLFFAITFDVNSHKDTSGEGEHYSPLMLSLIWAGVGIFKTCMITSSCNAAAGEAQRTAVLLQKLLLEPSLHPDIVKEIQLFLQQIRIRPVRFMASDFFTINHSTLCSFTGAVVTYLVILLQFHT
jgi:7tm Chemosensory receptor.